MNKEDIELDLMAIHEYIFELRNISDAAEKLGLDRLSEDLCDIAERIDGNIHEIDEYINKNDKHR